jgi:Arc/MetJ family transcription regulator
VGRARDVPRGRLGAGCPRNGPVGDVVAKVTISLDSDLAIEVMLLAGTRSPQDAVELIVRDYLERGHRTEARTGDTVDGYRVADRRAAPEEGR